MPAKLAADERLDAKIADALERVIEPSRYLPKIKNNKNVLKRNQHT
ncbi:hypothetical protein [Paraglaciecola sp. 20A4]|nr:hypothetical protein [Paraglaciecola sp. 20A4]